jgi:hypothetical protein
MLNGRLPLQLQRQFKLKLLNHDEAFIEYWLTLVLTTIPANSDNLDPVLKFLQERIPPSAIAFQVFRAGNIVICAHGIPDIATSSHTADGPYERWIVNCHIDLVTWNDVYKYYA